MRAWLRHLFSTSGFRGPVLTLLSGTGLSLLVTNLAQLVLRRLYSDVAFGLMDVFRAIVVILGSVASLRYEDALMQPESDEDAASLLGLATVLSLFVAAMAAVALIWREAIAVWLGAPTLAVWLVLVPVALVLMRLGKLFELWHTRQSRFRRISTAQVAQTTTSVSVRVGAGVPPLQAGTGGLVAGYLLGQVAVILVYSRAVVSGLRQVRRVLRVSTLRALAIRYRRFPLFAMPSTLLNTLTVQLPPLLLLGFFDESTVGQYGLAFQALALPLGLVGAAVAQVFFVRAAEALREGTLNTLTAMVHARLVAVGLFPTLVLLIAGPDIFAFVFGEAWRTAGTYVRYVGLWFFLATMVSSPLTRLFDVLERQRLEFGFSVLMVGALAVAFVVGGQTGDVTTTLLYVGVAGASTRLLHIGAMLRMAGVPVREALWPYLIGAARSGPLLIPLVVFLPLQLPWVTTLAAVVAGLGYLGLLLWQDGLLAVRP
ncbi:MAG: oligosaccharide flippase family protein [Bacteroidota bacterium]